MSSESNVHLVVNSRDDLTNVWYLPPNYQSTSYAAKNQNLVQGQIKKLSVNEVNFPYDIPNVMSGFNTFNIFCLGYPTVDNLAPIVIPPGFYNGTELATAVNTQIADFFTGFALNPLDKPVVSYDLTNDLFTFLAPAAPTDPAFQDLRLTSAFTFSPDHAPSLYGKDLLSIMGFKSYQGYTIMGFQIYGGFSGAHPLIGGAAPLTFTQYIDICSPQLCQFQELQSGNTTNFSRRTDIICRLYISNNIAVSDITGTRPFIINRQYQNERMMRWTADNSIGGMTIQLYDDSGQPLITQWNPRPFQITFNVYELERSI